MHLKRLEVSGFKSFAKKSVFEFPAPISAIVGPNGSGKSNVVEAVRFVLGEQSLKSLRGKRGEDLIFNGSKSLPRMNHARVAIVFDNTKREFNIDFDEVAISREVNRDSASEYFINGTPVRLRDIIELLAGVHIGASGHHIISQGEADRILNSSVKERKAMLEDALGLKIYHWKIAESEKKLEKTRENLKEAESLRRELAPHLKFLEGQVKKVEQARALREELTTLYREYLRREEEYLECAKHDLSLERKGPEEELASLKREHERIENSLRTSAAGESESVRKLKASEGALGIVRKKRDELNRREGRLDGAVEYREGALRKHTERARADAVAPVPRAIVDEFTASLEREIGQAEAAQEPGLLRTVFERIRRLIAVFREQSQQGAVLEMESARGELENLLRERDEVRRESLRAAEEERVCASEYASLRQAIEAEKDSSRDQEMALFDIRAKKSELASKLSMIEARGETLAREEERFREEREEARVLSGHAALAYQEISLDPEQVRAEERNVQEDRRRKIEKIKIRLEDIGSGSGEDILKEYDDTRARDVFWAKEIEDLKGSAAALTELMEDLKAKLGQEFTEGIAKINRQFEEFFALMFGGGSAALSISREKRRRRTLDPDLYGLATGEESMDEEDEEEEEGVDIAVNLPHKKIKGLHMLSGGERALTSIALLFAISQVNPPPFLVLDETDAALDEANSRKYGNMLENLSKYSQLIVVTHNRETMSRAGILYGVTMGSDAVSKLLSVKFDEAAAFAK